jgi:hypothetical protein
VVINLIIKPSEYYYRFEFIIDGTVKYIANKKRTFKTVFSVQNSMETEVVQISKITKWFKTKYVIRFSETNFAIIESTGGFKSNYICNYGNQNYYLYKHKGLVTSIFLNQIQIGYIEEEKVSQRRIINFNIVTNKDSNLLLICCLGLFIFEKSNYSGQELNNKNYNFGNIGPEEFKFNKTWKPDL